MVDYIFANNARGALSAGVGPLDTELVLGPGEGAAFPSPGVDQQAMVTLEVFDEETLELLQREICKVTSRTGDTLTVERGQEGTSALTWAVGARVSHRLTAGALSWIAANLGGSSAPPPDGSVLLAPAPGLSQTVQAAQPGDTPLTLRAASGQTAPLFGLKNSSGTLLASFNSAGKLVSTTEATALRFIASDAGSESFPALQIGGDATGVRRTAEGFVSLLVDGNDAAIAETPGAAPTQDRAIITRSKGDGRYLRLAEGGTVAGGVTLAGTNIVSGSTTVTTAAGLRFYSVTPQAQLEDSQSRNSTKSVALIYDPPVVALRAVHATTSAVSPVYNANIDGGVATKHSFYLNGTAVAVISSGTTDPAEIMTRSKVQAEAVAKAGATATGEIKSTAANSFTVMDSLNQYARVSLARLSTGAFGLLPYSSTGAARVATALSYSSTADRWTIGADTSANRILTEALGDARYMTGSPDDFISAAGDTISGPLVSTVNGAPITLSPSAVPMLSLYATTSGGYAGLVGYTPAGVARTSKRLAWDATSDFWYIGSTPSIGAALLTVADGDLRYAPISGGGSSGYLPLAGGTMTGQLVIDRADQNGDQLVLRTFNSAANDWTIAKRHTVAGKNYWLEFKYASSATAALSLGTDNKVYVGDLTSTAGVRANGGEMVAGFGLRVIAGSVTVTPAASFQSGISVTGTTSTTAAVVSDTYPTLQIKHASATSVNTVTNGKIAFTDQNGNVHSGVYTRLQGGLKYLDVGGFVSGVSLSLWGGNNEYMRADASAALNKFYKPLDFDFPYSGSPQIRFNGVSSGLAFISPYLYVTVSGTNVAVFDYTGTGTSSSKTVITRERGDVRYTQVSSAALKDGLSAPEESQLARVFDELAPRAWTWGGDLPAEDERRGRPGLGFVAEDLQEVCPEAVRDVDGLKALDTSALLAVVVAKVRDLERRLASE